MPLLIALLVVIVVTLGVFALVSLLDQRSSRARIIKDRLAAVQKTPDQPVEDVALLRDEQLSQIPALDAFLRRSERISAIQIMLAQGDTNMRAGNFLALCAIIAAVAGLAAFIWSGKGPVVFCCRIRMPPTGATSALRNSRNSFPRPLIRWPARCVLVTPSPQQLK
jgi:hypothetical protein